MRCRDSALAEPLAGTAPLARWWWLIEMPGPWGHRALEDSRVPVVRRLASTPERRVLLIRRRGRHPAEEPDSPLRVWVAGAMPGDPGPRGYVVDRHEDLLAWPDSGPRDEARQFEASGATPAPALVVCANSARDLCCGLDGRALVGALDDDRVWECSHLGGHRFAPTALLVGSGLVYGRLDSAAARTLLESGPTPGTARFLRGRSSLAPAAQAAEAHLLGRGIAADPAAVLVRESAPDCAQVSFPGLHAVELRLLAGDPRPASCGSEPEPWSSWTVVESA